MWMKALTGRVFTAAVLAAALALCAAGAAACTLFCLCGPGGPVCGQNLDWPVGTGAVVVNPRGLQRESACGAAWIAAHGSVAFAMFGPGLPLGGMNERGLVVAQASFGPSEYPRPAGVVLNEFEWIQYVLDRCATVGEALAALDSVSVSPVLARLHYLVADRGGEAAVVEFLGGRTVVHAGGDLPVAALVNNAYAVSLKHLSRHRGFGGDLEAPAGEDSPSRFVRVAGALADSSASGPAAARAAAILDSVRQHDTRWSIVYDQTGSAVTFRSDFFPGAARIEMDAVDFTAPEARMLRLDAIGDAARLPRFEPVTAGNGRELTRDALRAHVEAGEMTAAQAAAAAEELLHLDSPGQE